MEKGERQTMGEAKAPRRCWEEERAAMRGAEGQFQRLRCWMTGARKKTWFSYRSEGVYWLLRYGHPREKQAWLLGFVGFMCAVGYDSRPSGVAVFSYPLFYPLPIIRSLLYYLPLHLHFGEQTA